MTWSHLDPGTPEADWARALREHELPVLDTGFARLVIVSAHPDDETLGAAGLLRHAHGRGLPVDVVVVTDGENSHPDSPTTTPAELRSRRRVEVARALALVCPHARVHCLGVPDGAIEAHRATVAGAVGDIVGDGDGVLVVSPWTDDGHGDHRIVGEIAGAVATLKGARYLGYPIWWWHHATPATTPWNRCVALPLDAGASAAKRAALAVHASQIAPLSDLPGDEAILHAGMRAHFDRDVEVFVDPAPRSTPPAYFDEFWAGRTDPWGFDTRWYERRKRALLLAALPREHYAHALELGCANGALTAALADRCDRVLGVDLASAALDAARHRLADRPTVTLLRATLPREWPAGSFDLIVLAEIGYYLSADDLRETLERAEAALRPGGHLVACHWRHPVPDGPLDGDAAHAALAARPGLSSLVRHEEEDFLLEVFGQPPAGSVARETGLLA